MSVKASPGDSYENPKPGYPYISPSLPAFSDPGRKVRLATKAIDTEEAFAFAEVKGELVLMRSRGVLSNLCFVEIKTHRTDLLEKDPYRSGCYALSSELIGAV